jgi:hypothetical protein
MIRRCERILFFGKKTLNLGRHRFFFLPQSFFCWHQKK